MDYYTVTIRKWNIVDGKRENPSKKELRKQIKKQHTKLKKSIPTIVTEFSIEKDKNKKKYHTHLLIHTNHKDILFQQLIKFISAKEWIIVEREDELGINTNLYYEATGIYGLIRIHKYPYDMYGWRNYLNKNQPSETLV